MCKLGIVWNWFIAKIILIFQKKYSFYGYSKWWQVKQYSRLEQRSVIKFLVAEKCKPCEIYRMCDMYREIFKKIFLYHKMFTNGWNVGLPLQAGVEKTVHSGNTPTFQRLLGTVVSKSYADSPLVYERIHLRFP